VHPRLAEVLEEAVLVPVKLGEPVHEAELLEGGGEGRLIGGIRHGQVDVDDGRGDQTRHRGGPEVLDGEDSVAEGGTHGAAHVA
jgi:hypothetical protein